MSWEIDELGRPHNDRKLISIDLGLRVSGLALFDEAGMLVEAREVAYRRHRGQPSPRMMASMLVDAGLRFVHLPAVWLAERMKDYEARGARRKALEGLREVARGVRSGLPRGHRFKTYTARAWKGQVPKPITEERILGELAAAERARMVVTKETVDAVGIGLFHIGRLGRGMVSREPVAG